MKKKLIVANWKMNPDSEEKARNIVSSIYKGERSFGSARIVICPPFVFLNEVSKIIFSSKKIFLGAQDIFIGEGVSHTGEINSSILKKAGVKYIIVGHSERRETLDNDDVVREKLLGALKEGFKVILCIGEKQRNEHGDQYKEIRRQLEDAIIKLPKKFVKNLIIAYEPVWAIGKSEKEAMNGCELREVAIFIKKIISDVFKISNIEKISILYGGSVTHGNAKEIVEEGNVAGLLIGRESLKAENFIELIAEIK